MWKAFARPTIDDKGSCSPDSPGAAAKLFRQHARSYGGKTRTGFGSPTDLVLHMQRQFLAAVAQTRREKGGLGMASATYFPRLLVWLSESRCSRRQMWESHAMLV